MIVWCALLLVSAVSANNLLSIDIEELDRTFVGRAKVFKQFDFDLIACARNFAVQKEIRLFTYNLEKRECIGFTDVTGYSTPVNGTKTYFVKSDNFTFEQYEYEIFRCLSGWERFEKRCYQQVAADYQPKEHEATQLIVGGCSKVLPHAKPLSIHSAEEMEFVANRTTSDNTLVGLIAPYSKKNVNGELFKWADGTPLDYTNWAVSEPNNGDLNNKEEFLVQIYQETGKWNDIFFANERKVNLWCYYDLKHLY